MASGEVFVDTAGFLALWDASDEHHRPAAVDFLDTMERTRFIQTEWTDSLRFSSAATLFRSYHDKEWSFTDCLSFAVMRERAIRDAFTTDHHFAQAGFVPLLKA